MTSLRGKTRGTRKTISTTRTTTVLIVTPTRLGGNRSNSSQTSSPQDPSAGPVTMRGPTGKTLTLTIDPQTRITTGRSDSTTKTQAFERTLSKPFTLCKTPKETADPSSSGWITTMSSLNTNTTTTTTTPSTITEITGMISITEI